MERMTTLIRKQEAARILAISSHTLREWRSKGILIKGVHYVCLNSRSIRYIKESIVHLVTYINAPEEHKRYCEQFFETTRKNVINE